MYWRCRSCPEFPFNPPRYVAYGIEHTTGSNGQYITQLWRQRLQGTCYIQIVESQQGKHLCPFGAYNSGKRRQRFIRHTICRCFMMIRELMYNWRRGRRHNTGLQFQTGWPGIPHPCGGNGKGKGKRRKQAIQISRSSIFWGWTAKTKVPRQDCVWLIQKITRVVTEMKQEMRERGVSGSREETDWKMPVSLQSSHSVRGKATWGSEQKDPPAHLFLIVRSVWLLRSE